MVGAVSQSDISVPNPIYNELRVSPFHINDEHFADLLAKLTSYQPTILHGYPSALYQFSQLCSKAGTTLPSIRQVIFISENFTADQLLSVSRTFSCPVFSFYGLTERIIFAPMDSTFSSYYAHPAYGYTEFLHTSGAEMSTSTPSELVGTGFINLGMPLIKYKTGDYVSPSPPDDSSPYRTMPCFSKVHGRWNQEYLLSQSGHKLFLSSINMHSDSMKKVTGMQYHQSTPGRATIRILASSHLDRSDITQIEQEYNSKLNNAIVFTIQIVQQLERTPAGKVPFLVKQG